MLPPTGPAVRWAFRGVLRFSALLPLRPALQDTRAFVDLVAKRTGSHLLAIAEHEASEGTSRVHLLLGRLENGSRLFPQPGELEALWEEPGGPAASGARWHRAELHASAALHPEGPGTATPPDRLEVARIVGCSWGPRCAVQCAMRDLADPFFATPAPAPHARRRAG